MEIVQILIGGNLLYMSSVVDKIAFAVWLLIIFIDYLLFHIKCNKSIETCIRYAFTCIIDILILGLVIG